jgi:transposase
VVALGRPGECVVQVLRVQHDKPALEGLLERVRVLEPDPGEVRVVLETRHGLLVERLVEAGFVVVPVNPDLIARRRGPAKKKDDVEDARIACLLALDRFQPLRPLIPHGELAAELRLLGRDDAPACQDERRLLNRLRADLLAVFPAAVEIAGPDMGAPTFLRMLQRWPTATALAGTSRRELAFARAAHSGYPYRFADRVQQALGREHLTARPALAQAKVDTIQLTVAQLLLIGAKRRAWERRMGPLLLGAPRHRGGALPPQVERDRGRAVAGGEIYLSFPGLGDRLAARIAGEIGDHPEQFQTPNSLQCYAGQAPLTRRSGKRELLITRRLACNRHLADAVHKWAFASLRRSIWAKDYYDTQRDRGKDHHAALRTLGNRWLEILWHCLQRQIPYDEAVLLANRTRALHPAA